MTFFLGMLKLLFQNQILISRPRLCLVVLNREQQASLTKQWKTVHWRNFSELLHENQLNLVLIGTSQLILKPKIFLNKSY